MDRFLQISLLSYELIAQDIYNQLAYFIICLLLKIYIGC